MADSNLTPDAVARGHISRGNWAPELAGKTAIVTGAGRLRGIGRMSALEFARQGANVILTGTGKDPKSMPPDEQEIGWRDIYSVADEVSALGVKAIPMVVDISDESAVEAMIQKALAETGRVDYVVNNASAARGQDRKPVLEVDTAVWRRVMDVNVTGSMLVSRAAAREMVRQGEGGAIVNISSIAGKAPMTNIAAYAASKAALDMFSKCFAQEMAPHQIRVNSINPGAVETARLDDVGRGERWQAVRKSSPLGWASDGMDIAYMSVFLCSSMGAWITAQAINVDGGRTSN